MGKIKWKKLFQLFRFLVWNILWRLMVLDIPDINYLKQGNRFSANLFYLHQNIQQHKKVNRFIIKMLCILFLNFRYQRTIIIISFSIFFFFFCYFRMTFCGSWNYVSESAIKTFFFLTPTFFRCNLCSLFHFLIQFFSFWAIHIDNSHIEITLSISSSFLRVCTLTF